MLDGDGEAATVSIVAAAVAAAEGDVSDASGLTAKSLVEPKETDRVVEATAVNSPVIAPASTAASVSSTAAADTVVAACDDDGEATLTLGTGRIDHDDVNEAS